MDDIKDLILDKAKARFERFGFKKTTIEEISRDCKISKRTIYKQFKDKEDLFMCLVIREKRKARAIIFARMGEIVASHDKVIHLIKTAIVYFEEENFLTRLLNRNDELFSSLLRAKYHCIIEDEIISVITDIIKEGKRQGMFQGVRRKGCCLCYFKTSPGIQLHANNGNLRGKGGASLLHRCTC